MNLRGILGLVLLIGGIGMLISAQSSSAQETDDDDASQAPAGLSVDGTIRSNRGGFVFPDGSRMSGVPRVETGGPFSCTPAAGETRSCPLPGEWDLCSLSGMEMARFNAFVETSCDVVDRGGGAWAIDIESAGQFVIRCSAYCVKLRVE